eukprot:NODE_1418_length_1146_cov_219.498625.p1 GENE.NODE_1418_length_1146_cov_219.498625~~NODE_1418_length_1146_cov_219.498625.p1  ORF type:complete len:194 (+),score=28.73 NODE_1418_length_1146_cov_219.498625:3-584(+)
MGAQGLAQTARLRRGLADGAAAGPRAPLAMRAALLLLCAGAVVAPSPAHKPPAPAKKCLNLFKTRFVFASAFQNYCNWAKADHGHSAVAMTSLCDMAYVKAGPDANVSALSGCKKMAYVPKCEIVDVDGHACAGFSPKARPQSSVVIKVILGLAAVVPVIALFVATCRKIREQSSRRDLELREALWLKDLVSV